MQNPDIIFVTPSFSPILKEESVGTLILAKKAQLSGFDVEILRYWECESFSKEDYAVWTEEFAELILSKNPVVVSFYCRCTDYYICLNIARLVKERAPGISIVFGGPQAELVSAQTLKYFGFVDYVACSEGENTIVPLLEHIILRRGDKYEIAGLCHRDEFGTVVQNSFPTLLPNDYKRSYLYYDLIPTHIVSASRSLTIDVGRGCPFSCSFCSTKTFWKQQFRLRNIDNIIEEMKWLVAHFGISKFDFDHDMFTANKSKLRKFCHAIKDNDLDVKWYCSARLDCITTEDIDYMASAGMTNILFGVETGSERMQKVINKNLDFSNAKAIVKHAATKGVKVKVSFMYGFPEETESDFEASLRLMNDFLHLGAHVVVWRCGILNGTALYEQYKGNLHLSESNWKNYSFWGFKENIGLIKSCPDIFPQFYDCPGELRERLIYFDLFFYLWKDYARDYFEGAISSYLSTGKGLYNLYQSFVASNAALLKGYAPKSLDKFWDLSENERDSLISNLGNSIGHPYHKSII